MSILVRLPEPLRNGSESMTIDAPVATLGALVTLLEQRLPDFGENRDELFNFAVNGELVLHGEKDVPLKDGDEVEIVVAFSGG
jgi:molybdopterin converting factor small subunit